MSNQEHSSDQAILSTLHFTKEFPGFEIESKWKLLTENPVPTLLGFMSDLQDNFWSPFLIAKSMGKLPTGLRFFELSFDFWGIKNDDGFPSDYKQIAMVARVVGSNLSQVAFKEGTGQNQLNCWKTMNPPLVRIEDRKGGWVTDAKAIIKIKNRFPKAEKVASIIRQKCYVYIHNTESYRNFSVSADLCCYGSKKLSQVEVEYKGRSGLWIPDTTGHSLLTEFEKLHAILVNRYGKILKPTTQTKFEWITGG